MEENKNTITTENPAVNLLLFIIVIAVIIICIYEYKSYNELKAIHEILKNNTLF